MLAIPKNLERRFRDLVDKYDHKYDLTDHFRELRRSVRSGFAIHRGKRSKIPGTSRFGGIPDVPDVPDGFRWPRSPLGALHFVAQIKLSELPKFVDSLPRSGYLLFFAGGEGCPCAVFWFANSPKAMKPATPPDLDDFTPGIAHTPIFTATPIRFVPAIYIPPVDPLRCDDDDFFDRHYELIGQLEDSDSRLLGYSYYDPGDHGLPGGFKKWDPLLQVDSSYPCSDMLWNDNGKLAFFVRRGCVKRSAFGRPASLILGAG